jgi:hypothetical protein
MNSSNIIEFKKLIKDDADMHETMKKKRIS